MEGCLALLLLLPSLALADAVNNEWNSTTRSLSMGNVGIASAEDGTTAMFYNPAALARNKRTTVEIFNPQFDVGSGVFGLGGSESYSKHMALGKVRPLLEAKPGKASYLGTSIYPNVSAQNFNFGILGKAEGGAYSDGLNLTYRSRYLVIPTLGLAMGTLGGRFRLGFAARAIQITENDETTTRQGVGYTVNAAEGFGLGLDAGALITVPWYGLPTLGFVARNVGDTTFPGSAPFSMATGTSTRRQKVKMTYDAGFSLSPKFSKKSGLVFAVDYRDVQNVHNVTTRRRINLGLEFNIFQALYLRTGFGRGYWTAGMGLASKYGSLDMGTYAEELDDRSFGAKQDRRISLRYGSRF